MAYSCCFSKRENIDFLDFDKKKFYNINCRPNFYFCKIAFSFLNFLTLVGCSSLPQL